MTQAARVTDECMLAWVKNAQMDVVVEAAAGMHAEREKSERPRWRNLGRDVKLLSWGEEWDGEHGGEGRECHGAVCWM
jgi:hypothetical protein